MAPVYVLTSDLEQTVEFDWSNELYHVCPDCIRAHEQRTCHGEIVVTFSLCETHLSAPKHDLFDQVLLDEIRQSIHSVFPADKTVEDSLEQTPILLDSDHRIIADNAAEHPARPTISYAHGEGCSRTESPEVVTISLRAIALLDAVARERLGKIEALLDSDLFLFERGDLRLETIRLEACLGASKVAKGLYMKRCNGEYRNALDDEITADTASATGYRPSEFGYAMLDLDGARAEKRWTWKKNGWPNSIGMPFTFRNLKYCIEQVERGNFTEEQLIERSWSGLRLGRRSDECSKETAETA